MLHSRKILTLLFILILPLEALGASQSNAHVRVEEVRAQTEEQIATCSICRDHIPNLPSAFTVQVFEDITLDVEALEKTYQARTQQLTELLSNAAAPADQEAIRKELVSTTESYHATVRKEKVAEEMMQKGDVKALIEVFSLAQRALEERLNNLKKRSDETLTDEEKRAHARQIAAEEAQYLTLVKHLQLFSDPTAQQSNISQMLKAFLAENGMIGIYNESIVPHLKKALQISLDTAGAVLLECTHKFHKKCLADYAKSQFTSAFEHPTCPLCRASLSEKDIRSLSLGMTNGEIFGSLACMALKHMFKRIHHKTGQSTK